MAASGLTARQVSASAPYPGTVSLQPAVAAAVHSADPEARLVTLCVRESDAVAPGEIAAAARRVQDWGKAVSMAVRHRVAAYVLEAVSREGVMLPYDALQMLQVATLSTVIGCARINQEVAREVSSLHASGIPAMVLKGPALVRTIYPRPALRPYGDLDLAVQDRHQAAAERVLLADGYTEIDYDAEVRRQHAGHVHHGAAFHRQFTSSDGQVMVELHIDPLQLGLRPTCEADRWRRAVPVPGLAGGVMLCPEDQLVHLSAHVHKHGFDRLIWLKDLDMLLRTHGASIDWSLVEQTATREGVRGSVWYGLYLAARLLGALVPPAQLLRLRPSLPVRQLYRWVWPVERIAALNGFMRRRSVQFHVADSWRGMLPSLVLMGRRADRVRATAQAVVWRW